jgi:hypothetical protein
LVGGWTRACRVTAQHPQELDHWLAQLGVLLDRFLGRP